MEYLLQVLWVRGQFHCEFIAERVVREWHYLVGHVGFFVVFVVVWWN